MRDAAEPLHLEDCGISVEERFVFYDQVHTTGMDIKQAASARAALTLGKDMSFRDYAQGAYRMRGIGKGQTVELLRLGLGLGSDPSPNPSPNLN